MIVGPKRFKLTTNHRHVGQRGRDVRRLQSVRRQCDGFEIPVTQHAAHSAHPAPDVQHRVFRIGRQVQQQLRVALLAMRHVGEAHLLGAQLRIFEVSVVQEIAGQDPRRSANWASSNVCRCALRPSCKRIALTQLTGLIVRLKKLPAKSVQSSFRVFEDSAGQDGVSTISSSGNATLLNCHSG